MREDLKIQFFHKNFAFVGTSEIERLEHREMLKEKECIRVIDCGMLASGVKWFLSLFQFSLNVRLYWCSQLAEDVLM